MLNAGFEITSTSWLRKFSLASKKANKKDKSYNKINGIHASSHYELLTEVVRGEWGFEGLVMTDWGTQSTKPFDLHAGNDLIMGGYRTQYLMAALTGALPVFAENGYVKEEQHKMYFGLSRESIEYWNSFHPDKDGPDTVTAKVAPGVAVSEKVYEKQKEGIASIAEQPDGSKVISYRGFDRGAYLSLGDVQKSAITVLKSIAQSISFAQMVRQK